MISLTINDLFANFLRTKTLIVEWSILVHLDSFKNKHKCYENSQDLCNSPVSEPPELL